MQPFYVKSLAEKRDVKNGNHYLVTDAIEMQGQFKFIAINDMRRITPLEPYDCEFLGFANVEDHLYKGKADMPIVDDLIDMQTDLKKETESILKPSTNKKIK